MTAVAALVFAALFAGAAFYISIGEQYARATLEPHAQLAEWKPAYARGTAMQAPLALAGGACGLATGATLNDAWWTTGGIVLLGVVAWTFAAMWRLNNRIKATPLDQASSATVAQLALWAKLHAVRTALGLAATLIYAARLTTALHPPA